MADFHFLRPFWLIAIIALVYLIWQLKKLRIASSAWHKVIPKHLTSMLLSNEDSKKPISLVIPSIIGLLIIVAMAGPTWQKIPQPVFEVERGSVIIMDMSFSMLATDIKPNRVTMARFKAMDLVKEINEGEIGLVAYAGDAFIISPLTADINNINLLLPSLSPEIMPELGSNPYPALLLANDMLQNSGHLAGDIYWITDGIDMDELQDINDFVKSHDHRVNILGVGTEQGAPITLSNGELMKDRGGNIVIPKINLQMLAGVSSRSSGLFTPITADESDINKLGERPIAQAKDMQSKQDNLGDQWQEAGPYLLLLVLPLMLGYFRRGLLFMPVLLAFGLSTTYSPNAEASVWDDLWQTKDQQASKKFEQQQYPEAAQQFKDPLWKASSLYKAGEYEDALAEYQKLSKTELNQELSPELITQSNYNHANTLAKLQKFEEAITKYDEVLAEQPDHADALANKALIEQLKQQQDEQQQDQDSEDQQEQNQEEQQSDKNEQQNQDQNQQGDSGQQDDQSQSENSEQQQDSQDPQNSDQSDDAKPEQNENGDQNPDDKESDQQSRDNEQQNGEQNNSEEENQAQAQADTENKNAEQSDEQGAADEQMAGMSDSPTAEEIEANQKYEQLLKKVTDDPHLLLRNKMQLEYQKRRQNRSSIGVKEKW